MEMKPEYERRAIFTVSVNLIRDLFHFPEDVVIVGADYVPVYNIVRFHLKGSNKGLYNCAECGHAPQITDFEERK